MTMTDGAINYYRGPNLPVLDVEDGDPVGYTYEGRRYSGPDLVRHLVDTRVLSPGALGMGAEWALDQHAGANAIDRDDEESFTSDFFPTTISRDQLSCTDTEWAGALAPVHLVVGDEFPYCARCDREFEELSTLEGL